MARGEKATRFRERLTSLAAQAVLKPTTSAGGGHELARQAVREGFDTIVAAGGDGTLNEVLNGMIDEPGGLQQARLAVLPLGTVNVFAKELNLSTRLEDAWAVVLGGKESRIDLPFAQFRRNGESCRRYFAQLAGAGLDSRAIELVNWEYKKRFGQIAYLLAGLKAFTERKSQIVVATDTETRAGELVLIGNGKFYGGRYRVFPRADLRDGVLEVSIFPRANLEALLRGGWGLLTDQLYSTGGVVNFRASSLRLYSAGPVPFQVEGENVGHLPVEFGVERETLRVVVP